MQAFEMPSSWAAGPRAFALSAGSSPSASFGIASWSSACTTTGFFLSNNAKCFSISSLLLSVISLPVSLKNIFSPAQSLEAFFTSAKFFAVAPKLNA